MYNNKKKSVCYGLRIHDSGYDAANTDAGLVKVAGLNSVHNAVGVSDDALNILGKTVHEPDHVWNKLHDVQIVLVQRYGVLIIIADRYLLLQLCHNHVNVVDQFP